MVVRVVSYNVRSFRAGVGEAVKAVAADEPDLVMLQEYGPPYRLRAFARATGLDWASSYALWNRLRNAVLFRSPWRLVTTDIHRFTKTPGQHQRGFVAAHLENGRMRITAVSVHLGLSARERPRHAAELVAFLRDASTPVIVAGDLNEEPDGEAVGVLTAAFRSGRSIAGGGHPTFPAAGPTAAIDDVLVAGGVAIASFRVGHLDAARTASDHRPVVADLEFLPPAQGVG
jgi:endonuclease/exonuclease/phosphatase family metal-dependent hydrolase